MVQELEHLLSRHEALNSSLSTISPSKLKRPGPSNTPSSEVGGKKNAL
jgi:hypothetical protein